ncbi:ATP-binding protein [Kineococcus rubinsiae]|uniref:ATP-binding protein n=1 Tax=Kineococcus rubinsiae TaxID=2609562 RepID=UPI001431E60B|nr:ATP-binding protein [Kineococcus rubinsiae]NIZ89650.1 ATP-binding protein [Kineococcus rubinsiae]
MAHATLPLAAHLRAVPTARHWTNQHCVQHLDDESARQVVELLTSELVANAVLHGAAPFALDVDCDPRAVHVAVSDASPHPPQLRHASPEATGGRGIALVDMLATAWGHNLGPNGQGKVIWFTYDLTH